MECSPLEMYANPMYWVILAVVSAVGFAVWHRLDKWKEKRKEHRD